MAAKEGTEAREVAGFCNPIENEVTAERELDPGLASALPIGEKSALRNDWERGRARWRNGILNFVSCCVQLWCFCFNFRGAVTPPLLICCLAPAVLNFLGSIWERALLTNLVVELRCIFS